MPKKTEQPRLLHAPFTKDAHPVESGTIYYQVQFNEGSSNTRKYQMPPISAAVVPFLCTKVTEGRNGFRAHFRYANGCSALASWEGGCPSLQLFKSSDNATDHAASLILDVLDNYTPDDESAEQRIQSAIDDKQNSIQGLKDEIIKLKKKASAFGSIRKSEGVSAVTKPSREDIATLRKTIG